MHSGGENNKLLTVNGNKKFRSFKQYPIQYLALNVFGCFCNIFHGTHLYSNAVPKYPASDFLYKNTANCSPIFT